MAVAGSIRTPSIRTPSVSSTCAGIWADFVRGRLHRGRLRAGKRRPSCAEWTAHELGVLGVFAEHDQPRPGELRGRFVLRRGYDHLVKGKQVLVVDDIVNTGHSIRQTIEAVRAAGGLVKTTRHSGQPRQRRCCRNRRRGVLYLLEVKIPAWPTAPGARSVSPTCPSTSSLPTGLISWQPRQRKPDTPVTALFRKLMARGCQFRLPVSIIADRNDKPNAFPPAHLLRLLILNHEVSSCIFLRRTAVESV